MRRRALARLMNKNKTGKRGTPRGCHARARVAAGSWAGRPGRGTRAGQAARAGEPVLVGRAGKGFEHGRAVCREGLDDGSGGELLL
jgi:hypothetical protein